MNNPAAAPEATAGQADPVGVFDSGVGGVSVLLEIQRALPAENLIYVADSAHAPYGDKPVEEIQERAFRIVEILLQHLLAAVPPNRQRPAALGDGLAVVVLRHRDVVVGL